MKMTVLRAVEELEMDVDISETTEIAHMERDNADQITVYGTTQNGKLWYIVLDQSAVERIKEL